MREHRITFTFTDWAADNGHLDGSDADHYTEGTRQILAHNAFFFTTGMVPKGGALNRTEHYHVWKTANERGSFVDPWTVTILGSAVGMVLGEYAIRAMDYTYDRFLKDSLGAIIRRKPSSMPLELRREPYFPPQDKGNHPVFDEESEREHHWLQLRERSTLLMPKVTRPVGRSADKLAISSEFGEIGNIDIDVLRRIMADAQAYKEAAITSAVLDIRARQRRFIS